MDYEFLGRNTQDRLNVGQRNLIAHIAHLIEQTDAVAERTLAMCGNQLKSCIVDSYFFAFGNVFKMLNNFWQVNWFKGKTLRAAGDGFWQFVRFGGSQNEHHMRWRLL